MEDAQPSIERRWPILFCCAIIAPFAIMAIGGAVASRYMWPHPGGYTPLNIIVAFVLAELVITWILVIFGWRRGERPRWLALFGPILSVWSVWHIFFA
jgi:hypothetical protein